VEESRAQCRPISRYWHFPQGNQPVGAWRTRTGSCGVVGIALLAPGSDHDEQHERCSHLSLAHGRAVGRSRTGHASPSLSSWLKGFEAALAADRPDPWAVHGQLVGWHSHQPTLFAMDHRDGASPSSAGVEITPVAQAIAHLALASPSPSAKGPRSGGGPLEAFRHQRPGVNPAPARRSRRRLGRPLRWAPQATITPLDGQIAYWRRKTKSRWSWAGTPINRRRIAVSGQHVIGRSSRDQARR